MINIGKRLYVATKARAYFAGEISYQMFMDEFAGYDGADELIDELIDLIEHEPKRGGFMGVSERQWSLYQEQLQYIFNRIENTPNE